MIEVMSKIIFKPKSFSLGFESKLFKLKKKTKRIILILWQWQISIFIIKIYIIQEKTLQDKQKTKFTFGISKLVNFLTNITNKMNSLGKDLKRYWLIAWNNYK